MGSWILRSVIQKAGFSGLEGGTYIFLSHFLLNVQRLTPEIPFDSIFPRICPGKHFALRTLFLDISCTLAAFDIESPAGQPIKVEFHEAAIRCVMVLIFTLVPRGESSLIHGFF
jgi:hypothetical protein